MKDAKGHGSDPKGAHAAGIDAATKPPKFGTNKAENVREAARFIEQSGTPAEVYRKPGSASAAVWSQDKIHINASHRFWKDPVASMQRQSASGHLSSDSPTHVLNHELGHAMYDAPDNFFHLGHQDMARDHVSKYAAMNPKEFVSEVHAGMKAGKTYPEHVMTAFKQYAKPRVK